MIRPNSIFKTMVNIHVRLLTAAAAVFVFSGCAANYYPLKKSAYFSHQPKSPKSAVIVPIAVNFNSPMSPFNTKEKQVEKTKDAYEYTISGFKKVLSGLNIDVIDSYRGDLMDERKYDDQTTLILEDLLSEINNSSAAMFKNLNEDKGELADYSIGTIVEEINEKYQNKADYIVFVVGNGIVYCLTALESNAMNTAGAILTLGMSKLFPVMDDIVYFMVVVVDAKTGDIIWMNQHSLYGYSFLIKEHVEKVASELMAQWPLKDLK